MAIGIQDINTDNCQLTNAHANNMCIGKSAEAIGNEKSNAIGKCHSLYFHADRLYR